MTCLSLSPGLCVLWGLPPPSPLDGGQADGSFSVGEKSSVVFSGAPSRCAGDIGVSASIGATLPHKD